VRIVRLLAAVGLACVLPVEAARAQAAPREEIPDHPALSDQFVFNLGVFNARTSNQVGLAPPGGGAGVVIDMENALGLDERRVIALGGFYWRMSERWRLEMEYFRLHREGSRTLDTQINWGNQVFPIGTTVNSSSTIHDTRVTAGYSFFKRTDKELGAGFGLHVMGVNASIEAAGVGSDTGAVTAPLPVVNFYGTFALTSQWAVRMHMDWLSLSYSQYQGDVRSMAFDLLYQPFRHVGFGVGMRSLVLDLTIDDPKWRGRARSTFSGPAAFMTVSF